MITEIGQRLYSLARTALHDIASGAVMAKLRPLPITIVLMVMLTVVKTAGLLQAIDIGSPARASGTHEPEAKPAAEPLPAKVQAMAEPATPPAVAPDARVSEAERKALQELRARRVQLDAQAARLDEREALLSAAERRLTERLQQLSALQTKLEQLDKERHDRDEASWQGLVKTYESMRPRDAATIFNDLDSAVLIPVLDRMKERKAAPILAAMAPERARAVTAQLAQWRNRVNAAPRLDGTGAATK